MPSIGKDSSEDAAVAQLVEQSLRKRQVVRSSRTSSTTTAFTMVAASQIYIELVTCCRLNVQEVNFLSFATAPP